MKSEAKKKEIMEFIRADDQWEPVGPTPMPDMTTFRNWTRRLLETYKPFYAPFCDMCCHCTFGKCDLSTVVSKNASLADAAATLAGNLVKQIEDISPTLERVLSIPGIDGILIVKDGQVGLGGNLPKLVQHKDQYYSDKITKAFGIQI